MENKEEFDEDAYDQEIIYQQNKSRQEKSLLPCPKNPNKQHVYTWFFGHNMCSCGAHEW